MEYAPLRRTGKGGEAPSFTARFLFLGVSERTVRRMIKGEAENAFSLLLRSMIGGAEVVALQSS
jgi:hypothetical protein